MDHDPPMDWSDETDPSGYDDGTLGDEPGGEPDLPGFEPDDPPGFDDTPETADTATGDDDTPGRDDVGYDDPGQAADRDDEALRDDPSDAEADDRLDTDEPALPEPVSGAQPDLDLLADDPGWADEDPFPPTLDVGEPPEPVDGFPWSDPAMLGEQQDTGSAGSAAAPPDPAGLAAYDQQDMTDGADPWQALAGSDDPATSSLARWWASS